MRKQEKQRIKEIEKIFRNLEENEWVSKEVEQEYVSLCNKYEREKSATITNLTLFFSSLALIINVIGLLLRL